MPADLEQPVEARLISAPNGRTMVVRLRYDTGDPIAVQLVFPGEGALNGEETAWFFGRDLLEEGLAGPAGPGDVRIRPDGRGATVVELHADAGMAVIEFDSAELRRFLLRSYDLVPLGEEDGDRGIDRLLAELLREV